jgi:hypothetical protein
MTVRLLYHLIGARIQSDAMHKATLSMGLVYDDAIDIRTVDAEMT